MAQKDMLSARERRLRRLATRKGLAIRKASRGHDRGRYLIVDPGFGGPIGSRNRAHPYSFSLEEGEDYIAELNQRCRLRASSTCFPH
jgi:hypothetical protein